MADAQATPEPARLDEVMLAMDVVDTLRHRQNLVARELARPETDEELIERLRQIYDSQGIEVSDRILREGVEALREDRFTYRPPQQVPLWMRLYVDRLRWSRRLLVVAILAVSAFAANQFLVVAPREALARDLSSAHARIVQIASQPEAVSQADALYEEAQAAFAAGDIERAEAVLTRLEELRNVLELSYDVVITSGEEIGIWRTPDANPTTRNYYLIVEARGEQGDRVALPVRNEETGQTERVSEFGLGVSEATWERVADDLADDGIIQDEVVGTKDVGETEPEYFVETTGGAITGW